MRSLTAIWNRVRALFERSSMEEEMAEEIAFHLQMEAEKHQAQGLTREEAGRRARIEFGGVDRHKEAVRRSWGTGLLFDLWGDLRHALRQILRYRAFSGVAVLTLALGIGGTVALLSVAYGILLRPLPVADEQHLMVFWSDYNWRGVEFDYVKDRLQTFEGLAAYSNRAYTLRTDGASTSLLTTVASAEIFDILGARPLLGRAFKAGDDRPGSEPVVVLSHGLWEREFSGDPEVVGSHVFLDGRSTTVIGVMPAGFFFPTPDMRAWVPLDLDPNDHNYQGNGWLVLIGRLREGISSEGMQQDLDALAGTLGERFTYPEAWDKTKAPSARPLRAFLLGEVQPAVILLLVAVGLLLLMACANVAALLLTRTNDRAGEMSVRAALGAGRFRLARQLLTEAVTLGGVGGLGGLLLATLMFNVLVASLPLQQGFGATLHLDWTALLGAVVLSVLTGALVALAPIRHLLGGNVDAAALRERRSGGVGGGAGRMQAALVVAEVLLAVILVTGAALLVRSVDRLHAVPTGLDGRGVLTADLFIGAEETPASERTAFFRHITARAAALPGVEAAGVINRLPIRDGGYQGPITVEDRPDLTGTKRPNTAYRVVTPSTFDALGIQIIAGRGIEPTDTEGSAPVVVVNETFAREMFPGERALGHRIGATFSLQTDQLFTIVGVIRNVAVHDLVSEVPRAAYYPWEQVPAASGGVLVVRTGRDPTGLTPALREAVGRSDRRAAVGEVATMQEVVDAGMAENLRLRFFLMLFAVLGLILGSVGVYGVCAYAVRRRRVEFGIRMALGAGPVRTFTQALRIGLIPVTLGVVLGTVMALGLSGLLRRFLYEVPPDDPVAFSAAAAILLGVGLAAALIPSLRASRADPAEILRSE